jgi:hypothetical protein
MRKQLFIFFEALDLILQYVGKNGRVTNTLETEVILGSMESQLLQS